MVAPNLRSPTLILGKTAAMVSTETPTALLANPADSGLVLKVNSLRLAAGELSAIVTLSINHGGSDYTLLDGVAIEGASMMIVLNKDEYLYLEEGDSIAVSNGATGSVTAVVSYEEIS